MKIKIENLTKKFADTVAVNDFSVDLPSGELIALLGPSGCGKSTILNMLSGIVPVTSGTIWFDDRNVTNLEPEKRGIGLVFQDYALYPHMTVMQNISFPLEIKKVPKSERIERITKMAKLVHVEELMNRKPKQLSGGQQQRVAIARAMVKEPQLLLLDEPLSNLDARLRIEMREEIRRIQQETKVTTIFVTHDQEEAMSISDHIVVMKAGKLQQMAKPQELYDSPANEFVADFLGNPPINKLYGVIENGKIRIDQGPLAAVPGIGQLPEGKKIILSIRAESFQIGDSDVVTRGNIRHISIMGKEELAYLEIGKFIVRAYIDAENHLEIGEEVNIGLKNRGFFVFDAETGERMR